MVIRGTEILSRGGSKGRVEKFRQTWWCLVLMEAVMQEVSDLSSLERALVIAAGVLQIKTLSV